MLTRVFFLLAVVPVCRTRLAAEAYYAQGSIENADLYDRYNEEIRSLTTVEGDSEGRSRLKRWRVGGMGDYWTLSHETVVDVKGVQNNALQGEKSDPLRVSRNPHQHTDSYVYVEKAVEDKAEHTTDQRRQFQEWLSTLADIQGSSGGGTEENTAENLKDTSTEQNWSFQKDESETSTYKNDILAELGNQRPIRAGVVPKRSSVDGQISAENTEDLHNILNYPQETKTYIPSDMQAEVRKLVQHWNPTNVNDMNPKPQETTKYNPSKMEAEVRKLVQHWSPGSNEDIWPENAVVPAGVRQLVQHWSPSSSVKDLSPSSSVHASSIGSSLHRPTKTSKIATKTNKVATKASKVATKTNKVATKASKVTTKASKVATKTSKVATKTSKVATKASKVATKTSIVVQKNLAVTKMTPQRTGKWVEVKKKKKPQVPLVSIQHGTLTSLHMKPLEAAKKPRQPPLFSPAQTLISPPKVQIVSQTINLQQWKSVAVDQALNSLQVIGVRPTAGKDVLRQDDEPPPDEPPSPDEPPPPDEPQSDVTTPESPSEPAPDADQPTTTAAADVTTTEAGAATTTEAGAATTTDAAGATTADAAGATTTEAGAAATTDAAGATTTDAAGATTMEAGAATTTDAAGATTIEAAGATTIEAGAATTTDAAGATTIEAAGATTIEAGAATTTDKAGATTTEAGATKTEAAGATTSPGATDTSLDTTTKTETRTTTEETTTDTTTTTQQPDIDAIMAIIANLTYDYEWNLTEQFNKSVIDHGIPTCPWKGGGKWGPGGIWTATTLTATTSPYDFENASVVSKCFVCGLTDTDIPRDAHCADAFAGDFLPLMPIDARSRGKIAGFRKYCRYIDTQNYVENPLEPKAIYGRFTGGCAVRWTDLTGVYTQRTCRAKYRPLLGKHFASKRMAKLELALVNVEVGCIISPMATLLPVSRGISLYARFHACVCKTNWCNRAMLTETSTATIITIVLAHWLVYIWPS